MSDSSLTNPSGQPLRSAMKTDDDSDRPQLPGGASPKVVQIAEPEPPYSEAQLKRQYSANVAKRLSGRPTPTTSSSRTSLTSLIGQDNTVQSPEALDESTEQPEQPHRKPQYVSQKLLSQVSDWLENERSKKELRGNHSHLSSRRKRHEMREDKPEDQLSFRHRTDSIDSNSSDVALDKLQRILEDNMSALGLDHIPRSGPMLPKRSSSSRQKKLSSRARASSDTDYVDGDAVVPTCDAVLDNTRTLSYNAGKSSDNLSALGSSKAEAKEREAWAVFRNEIIRLAHTLRIKGWRRIPLDSGDKISVERLSGALTNAVYVVTPPNDVEKVPGKKGPTKVLLRIYGPHVEHLIDRENELSVLRRLARKKIGPRLLGTFTNGRFEQYFNSTTLTPSNLRDPDTYKQIAKRMRELHDGIELLEDEREAGPNVWRNWDKWLDNVEKRVLVLDEDTRAKQAAGPKSSDVFPGQGFVCGDEWHKFKAMAEKYRAYLNSMYRDAQDIKQRLVFAHNDTQYGNILRVRPDDEKSPLLKPANEHKQLIVIDFEYSAANLPGLEFANHFTEWAYNYHDALAPHACRTEQYPALEHQRRFIKSYVDHRPQFPHAGSTPRLGPQDTPSSSSAAGSASGTSALGGGTTPSSSIVDFMLDARVPSNQWSEAERQCEEQSERMVDALLEETRLWRPANTMMWVAWGIVQAKVPGSGSGSEHQEGRDETVEAAEVHSEASGASSASPTEEDEEFDYLSYAQDRALFFWGDCVLMGLCKEEDLPEDVRGKLKYVER